MGVVWRWFFLWVFYWEKKFFKKLFISFNRLKIRSLISIYKVHFVFFLLFFLPAKKKSKKNTIKQMAKMRFLSLG